MSFALPWLILSDTIVSCRSTGRGVGGFVGVGKSLTGEGAAGVIEQSGVGEDIDAGGKGEEKGFVSGDGCSLV